MRWSEEEFAAYQGRRSAPKPREAAPRKYRNVPVEVDGLHFDSKWEAQRWHELRTMEKAGLISRLERQIEYDLVVPHPVAGDGKIAAYILDFSYFDEERQCTIYEDAKGGASTPEFRLKAKLMLALHGIDVVCVRRDGSRHSGAKRRPPRKRGSRRKPN